MDLPLKNCIATDQHISASQFQALLQFPHVLTYAVLDLQLLEEEIISLGGERALNNHLSPMELKTLSRLSLSKRKREWIGGRIVAKYATAILLAHVAPRENLMHWANYSIAADDHGRPFLSFTNKDAAPVYKPDISISHSGSRAAAMAVLGGYCGIDIQKVTPRVLKVSGRFCISGEEQVLQEHFRKDLEARNILLTKLWAAKEALRKASNMGSLPGFLELELFAVLRDHQDKKSGPEVFLFNWKNPGTMAPTKCKVAVSLMGDYVLALTGRDDTLAD